MPEAELPQIYLISPQEISLSTGPDVIASVLDAHEIACFRLALSSTDADHIARTADAMREVCHARDVAIVIEAHVGMVERLGLDGVHLTDGARSVRKVRKDLGADAIVGAYCGASKHDGLNAGEAGADYVSFGPLADNGLGQGTIADKALFEWWSEMIEVPIVAEGLLNQELVSQLQGSTDFYAIGAEIWNDGNPQLALTNLLGSRSRS